MTERPLGNLLEVIIDHRGKTPKKLGGTDFTDAGVPVVSAIHIKNGRINWEERLRFAPQWMFEKWMPVRLKKGDVLLTSEAPLGEVAQVETDEPLILSQRLFALRGKQGLLDSTYLRYFLQSSEGQSRLLARASGTTVFGIRQAELVKVLVPLPPLNEQRQIAGVLGAFDDLIDTTTQLASRAQSLAVALLEGAEEVTALSEVAVPVKAPLFRPVGTVEHYSLPAFDAGGRPETVDGGEIKSGKQRLVAPSVLVSRLNPQTPRVWMSYPTGEAAASTEFVILAGKDDVAVEEIWAACSSQTFASEMRSRVTGTTGSHQRVDKAAIPTIEVPDPRSLGTPHRRAVVSLVQEADGSLAQAAELAKIRDELLPLLMSGRITVDEAWEAVP